MLARTRATAERSRFTKFRSAFFAVDARLATVLTVRFTAGLRAGFFAMHSNATPHFATVLSESGGCLR